MVKDRQNILMRNGPKKYAQLSSFAHLDEKLSLTLSTGFDINVTYLKGKNNNFSKVILNQNWHL